MSKKKEEFLFRLIKQMTKNEKRHFTMSYGRQNKKSKDFQLYEAIDKMDQLDVPKLSKICPKNLSTFKKRLYNKVLQAMREYERNAKSVKIKEYLIDARYLLERGLYDQGEERLYDAKKLASEIGDQIALLEISNQERHFLRMNTDEEIIDHKSLFDNAIQEKTEFIENAIKEYDCLDRYDQLFTIVKTNTQVDKEELKKRFPPEIFELSNKPNTLMAERRFYQTGALFYQLLGDSEKLYFYFSKVLEWWDRNIEFRQEANYWYVADQSNFIQAYFFRFDLDGAEEALKKLEKIKEEGENEHTRNIAFYAYYTNKISYLILRSQFEEAKQLVEVIEVGLKKANINPGSRLALYFNILIIFFIFEDHKQLKVWVDKVLNFFKSSYRKDIQHIVLILDVLICLEKEEKIDETEAYKDANSHFQKRLKLPKDSFERTTLKTFNKLSNLGFSDRKDCCIGFKAFLEELRTSNPRITGLDALLYWTESKILRIPLIEVVRIKLKR